MSVISSAFKNVKPQHVLKWGKAATIVLHKQGMDFQSIALDGRLIIFGRALRTFGYGFMSILLGVTLTNAGVSPAQIGLLLTVATLGSITFSLVLGMYADRIGRKVSLVVSALLMVATGCVFAFTGSYPLLLMAAFCGSISSPTSDTTPFSAIEQSILAQSSPPRRHTRLFACYNLAAQFAGAVGGLAVGLPGVLLHIGLGLNVTVRCLFLLYGLLAGSVAILFLTLSSSTELQTRRQKTVTTSLTASTVTHETGLVPYKPRLPRIVLKLSSLFVFDAFAGGLAVQTILVVWFRYRFGASLASLGLLFFGMNLLAALSLLSAPRLTRRFGLLKTMIVPHFVSNVFLLFVAFMPNFSLAAMFLLLHQSVAKLDVPARQVYTLALVSPQDRTAAASCTTIVRSIATCVSPLLSGFILSGPLLVLGLPILLASCIGLGYDVTLWRVFRHVPLHSSHTTNGKLP